MSIITSHIRNFKQVKRNYKAMGFDPDYADNVLSYADFHKIQMPPDAILWRQNQLMIDLKNLGLYQKADSLAVFSLNNSSFENFALIDWKRKHKAYSNNGISYQVSGFKGNQTDTHVATNYIADNESINYKLEDASRISVLFSVPGSPSVNNSIIDSSEGSVDGGEGHFVFNTTAQRINHAQNQMAVAHNFFGTGTKALRRDNLGVHGYNNGVPWFEPYIPSLRLSPDDYLLLKRGPRFSLVGISFYMIASFVEDTMLDDFRDIYNDYLLDIGLTQFA